MYIAAIEPFGHDNDQGAKFVNTSYRQKPHNLNKGDKNPSKPNGYVTNNKQYIGDGQYDC